MPPHQLKYVTHPPLSIHINLLKKQENYVKKGKILNKIIDAKLVIEY